jgi:glycosyltransferase involved in cell wall biosynthesis
VTGAIQDISVIICAYTEDRWDDLVAAVESVQRQSRAPREIVVVIDHNPNLLARVRMHLPGVVAIENLEPRGLGGARNSGIAASSGAMIAFLDDDAIAAPDWLEQLLAGYEVAEVMGVGGSIEPIWQDGRPAWFPEEFDWVVGCTYRGMPQTKGTVRNLIGCNMSFRREVFGIIEGFRHDIGRVGAIPFGCEETEFCIRLRQRRPDAILLYEPGARVYHRVPERRARWRYFRSRCYAEGRSKAAVSQFVGPRDGLATERIYISRTLPSGIICGMREMVLQRDRSGGARASVIVAALGITAASYLVGLMIGRLPRWQVVRRRNQLT